MRRNKSDGSVNRTLRVLLASTSYALAVAAPVYAQSESFPNANPYAYDGSLTGTENRQASHRSIFVGTLVALLAQSIGNGVGNALSNGLGNSITKWFEGKPSTADPKRTQFDGSAAPRVSRFPTPSPAASNVRWTSFDAGKSLAAAAPAYAPTQSATRASKGEFVVAHAGIAYEIYAIDRRGVETLVDAASHSFRTGDLFRIYYRPTLPGRIRVTNIDPAGGTNLVDRVEVAAGQLVNLGPYEFVGTKGLETLRLLLEPCESDMLMASTRSIVKLSTGELGQTASGLRITPCGQRSGGQPQTASNRRSADVLQAVGPQSATRSIRKTSTEGSTVYALDRLSARELNTGELDARSVDIKLFHR